MEKHISARRVVVTSFLVDVSDLVLNMIVASLSGSAVMLSQAIQGGADLLTSGLLLVGINQSRGRANKRFRFGRGRELFFWVLIACVTMFTITGTVAIHYGLNQILDPQPIRHTLLAFLVLSFALISNSYALFMSYQRLKGSEPRAVFLRRLRHSSLIETKTTFVLDLLGTVSSLFGLAALGSYWITGNIQFDGVGAIIIGITTAVFAISLIRSVKDLLVGQSATDDIEALIREAALEVRGVQSVLDLRTMYLGSERLLVNIEVNMQAELRTEQIERRIDSIKTRIKQRAPIVSHVQVELETATIREPFSRQ